MSFFDKSKYSPKKQAEDLLESHFRGWPKRVIVARLIGTGNVYKCGKNEDNGFKGIMCWRYAVHANLPPIYELLELPFDHAREIAKSKLAINSLVLMDAPGSLKVHFVK